MMKTDRIGKTRSRNQKAIVPIIFLCFFIVLSACRAPERRELKDIRWNNTPDEIEITFENQESILLPSRERYFSQRFRLRGLFMQNEHMLREVPQEGDFKVRFEYSFRVWFAFVFPLVQERGATATFYADASLEEEVREILLADS